MIEFLIEVRENLLFIYLSIFFIGLLGIAFLFHSKPKNNTLFGIAFIIFMVFLIIGLNMIISTTLRNEIIEKSEFALKNDSRILINGKEEKNLNKKELLTDLSNVNSFYFNNHSHPETKYLVSIISKNDTLNIQLERDFNNAEKYWVFLPKYNYEMELDIMKTETLNKIKGID
ncbi:hypothetical protein [Lutibacter citreus]|uniref:hypothetical protein n=1 Tax=Lutibacter citreus TaxID=2138210 RepID=UPI000DBE2277|nr:hypothetical protein [Lutibacter citreus]